MVTMGDVARCSVGKPGQLLNEELLYKLFGVNAELLIDHAWGWEPCTIAAIKAYKPESSSVGSGQVLQEPYPFQKARTVLREMTGQLALDLVDKGLVTNQLVLTVGYDRESLENPKIGYRGEITTDAYGRKVPKHAHGTENLTSYTSSSKELVEAATALFDRIVNPKLLVRRFYMAATHVVEEGTVPAQFQQLDLFSDPEEVTRQEAAAKAERERERKRQEAMLSIKKKFGKNAILEGISFTEGATGRERNETIGGHKA